MILKKYRSHIEKILRLEFCIIKIQIGKSREIGDYGGFKATLTEVV